MKKRNPQISAEISNQIIHLYDIKEFIEENSLDFKYLSSGAEGIIYKFELDKNLILHTEILKPNKYVLKLYYESLHINKIKKLMVLSNYGLIPEIFYMTTGYSIMQFIDGYTVEEVMKKYGPGSEIVRSIMKRIGELEKIWFTKLKITRFEKDGYIAFDRGSYRNFIVSKDFKRVWVIDPRVW